MGVSLKSQPVELVSIAGDDITIAAAAWYSTALSVTEARAKRVPALLQSLAQGDPPEGLPHGVPFEHTLLTFRVTSDISTHIHFLKHRIGVSISSQSQRYMELRTDLFYVPEDWPADMQLDFIATVKPLFDAYHDFIKRLEAAGIDRKRAKESARLVLPYATQIHYLVSFNLLSFIHFQSLRNTDHAQDEIQLIAAAMLRLVKDSGRFENALKAWNL